MINHEYITNGHFCSSLNYFIKHSPCKRDISNVYFNSATISIDEIYTIYKNAWPYLTKHILKVST